MMPTPLTHIGVSSMSTSDNYNNGGVYATLPSNVQSPVSVSGPVNVAVGLAISNSLDNHDIDVTNVAVADVNIGNSDSNVLVDDLPIEGGAGDADGGIHVTGGHDPGVLYNAKDDVLAAMDAVEDDILHEMETDAGGGENDLKPSYHGSGLPHLD